MIDPKISLATGFAAARLMQEAGWVIGMRMMGLAGLWTVNPSENMRMVTEKQTAFLRAAIAATAAAPRGPDAMVSAALKPISRTAEANRRRLGRAGPKFHG